MFFLQEQSTIGNRFGVDRERNVGATIVDNAGIVVARRRRRRMTAYRHHGFLLRNCSTDMIDTHTKKQNLSNDVREQRSLARHVELRAP